MTFDKNNPFLATIVERRVLNSPASEKCTVHLSLDISGSHLNYKVGDSIGVYPKNSPLLVKETLSALNADPNMEITHPRSSQKMSLHHYLSSEANLSKVTKKWIEFAYNRLDNHPKKEILSTLLEPENKEKLKSFCAERQLWDFLKEFAPKKVEIDEVLKLFSPLLPRFYSIASSQSNHPNRIDLLIAYFKYTTNKHLRHGVASHYLCEMEEMYSPTVPMYIHPSKEFTLPEDHTKPIIMVGPGTGIAPFRAFMQERIAQNAKGNHWLFFGDWKKGNDYYYSNYWEQLQNEGKLKVSLAFSRDQEHKIYVQHNMLNEAAELWKWLNKGAFFYVCGDASQMAKDVEQALLKIIEDQGQKTPEEAKDYLKGMKTEKRYLRDVY